MNRPLYENDTDRESEKLVADFLVQRWNLTACNKLPFSYGLDYALMRDPVVIAAYAEIKVRPGVKWQMPGGYYVAVSKVIAAKGLKENGHLPCFLVVRCADGEVAFWNFDAAQPGVIWAGRKDRGDSADMEPHKVFSWETAKILK